MIHLGDRKIRQHVIERLSLLGPETSRQWGQMTAGQMVCHLNDSFQVAMGLKIASEASSPRERTFVKWAALYLPVQWPKGVPTRPEVEQGAGGTPPGDFCRDRAALMESIERFCDPQRPIAGRRHLVFGPMSRPQWLRWGYLHTDHHLRQFGV